MGEHGQQRTPENFLSQDRLAAEPVLAKAEQAMGHLGATGGKERDEERKSFLDGTNKTLLGILDDVYAKVTTRAELADADELREQIAARLSHLPDEIKYEFSQTVYDTTAYPRRAEAEAKATREEPKDLRDFIVANLELINYELSRTDGAVQKLGSTTGEARAIERRVLLAGANETLLGILDGAYQKAKTREDLISADRLRDQIAERLSGLQSEIQNEFSQWLRYTMEDLPARTESESRVRESEPSDLPSFLNVINPLLDRELIRAEEASTHLEADDTANVRHLLLGANAALLDMLEAIFAKVQSADDLAAADTILTGVVSRLNPLPDSVKNQFSRRISGKGRFSPREDAAAKLQRS